MKSIKRYFYFILAAVTYVIIHEGTHILVSLIQGNYQGVRLMPLGIEVMITEPVIMDYRLGVFSLLSSIMTITMGWVLYFFRFKIIKLTSRTIKNYLCYVTMVFLVLDPVYLSILSFFVGGDINGITKGFGLSPMLVRLVALLLSLVGTFGVRKKVLPLYVEDFQNEV